MELEDFNDRLYRDVERTERKQTSENLSKLNYVFIMNNQLFEHK